MTTLLGANGAGKSSLVLAIAGLLRSTGGRVLLDDRDLTNRRPEQIRSAGVAVVPEGRRLLPGLTVEDNMRVATYSLGAAQAKHGIAYALELFPELERRWSATARLLSGGEQQMVVLAQALVSQPKIVLVDELSLGLAPVVVKRLVPTLETAAANGVGVLLIEQFAHVALGLAETAYVIERGRIRYEGPAQKLKDEPELLHSAYLLAESRLLTRNEHRAAGDLAVPEPAEDVVDRVERVGLGLQGDPAGRVHLEQLPEVDPRADEIAHHRVLVHDERARRDRDRAAVADDRVRAAAGEHLGRGGVGLVGADEVEDEVGAAAAGQVAHRGGGFGSVDDFVRPELGGEPPAALVGVDRDHRARAELADELERDVADTAHPDDDGGRAGDGEMCKPPDRVVRGQTRVRMRVRRRRARPRREAAAASAPTRARSPRSRRRRTGP